MSPIERLASHQLEAYNLADLDAFVACYHPEVRVFDHNELVAEGRTAFRSRYQALFQRGGFGATVPQRIAHGDHCVDLENWWRIDPETNHRSEGTVMVHYVCLEELIGEVRFLR